MMFGGLDFYEDTGAARCSRRGGPPKGGRLLRDVTERKVKQSDGAEAKQPLEELIRDIESRAEKSDEHVIAAALSMRALRLRIEAGEVGVDVKWPEWAPKNIRLKRSRLFVLDAVGRAVNPHVELARQRELERERSRKKRSRERALEPDRKELIAWAKSAPIEEVSLLMRGIRIRTNTGNIPPNRRSVEVANMH